MADVIAIIFQLALSIGITTGVVLFDRRRLTPEQLARGWNQASFLSAVFAFAPICIVAHFWVTRRSVLGIVLGLAWLAAALVVQVMLSLLLSLIIG